MTDLRHITDPDDPRVSEYIDLNDPELRKGIEAAAGFFIAESPHVIVNVARAGRRFRSVLVTPKQQVALAEVLTTLPCPVYVADERVLRRVVGFNLHRGAVAAVDRWPLPELAAVLAGAARVAVVERVNDHENLGVLFRNAAALGIDAIVLDHESADPLYRRCVRVSIGHACAVPWTRYDRLTDIVAAGFAVIALTPSERCDATRWLHVAGAECARARCRGARPVGGNAARGRRARAHPDGVRCRLAERRDGGRHRVLRSPAQPVNR